MKATLRQDGQDFIIKTDKYEKVLGSVSQAHSFAKRHGLVIDAENPFADKGENKGTEEAGDNKPGKEPEDDKKDEEPDNEPKEEPKEDEKPEDLPDEKEKEDKEELEDKPKEKEDATTVNVTPQQIDKIKQKFASGMDSSAVETWFINNSNLPDDQARYVVKEALAGRLDDMDSASRRDGSGNFQRDLADAKATLDEVYKQGQMFGAGNALQSKVNTAKSAIDAVIDEARKSGTIM